ncbi:hypothetical protein J3D55_000281 [Chryseobacterium ginsenosidimutans]|uniref:hypothetical protein n=1 Tax=Chryseobacterium ginsenosidimutans TaxID=687846 RepID=UPI002169F127|nr:hypothetical protein [Chryseobacterium ginsenosidimutans]MCS3867365.1 hypothetical protein [Chryseobacterium ginsenosidimutans]
MEQEKKKSSRKKIVISILVVILIACLGLSFYVYKKNSEKQDYGTDSTTTTDDYNYWKDTTFRVSEYDDIPENYKRAIVKLFIDNNFYSPKDGEPSYYLTRIKDRAKDVYAFGNFTGKTEQDGEDMAFILEKNDFKSSAIYIISSGGDLLHWQEYEGELPIISSFAKGSKIFMDDTVLQPSPEDGLIVKFNSYRKVALVYNSKIKKFEEYHQYSKDELEDMKNQSEYEEGDEEEPAVEAISDSAK